MAQWLDMNCRIEQLADFHIDRYSKNLLAQVRISSKFENGSMAQYELSN